jgi:anti-sigma regulatory factor (Ser/Thr protein kinase)
MRLDQAMERPDLYRRVPATAEQIRTLRHALTGWAERAGLTGSQVDDLEIASYEAMANVVCHAYPGRVAGALELHATRKHGRVHVSVIDHGRWQAPPSDPGPLHGRGLPLIHSLTADVHIDATEHGTTVRMTWPCPA